LVGQRVDKLVVMRAGELAFLTETETVVMLVVISVEKSDVHSVASLVASSAEVKVVRLVMAMVACWVVVKVSRWAARLGTALVAKKEKMMAVWKAVESVASLDDWLEE
jgi:hypothetical protein